LERREHHPEARREKDQVGDQDRRIGSFMSLEC